MPHLTTTVQLSVGWTLIGWPQNAPMMTNEALLEDLAQKGFEPDSICRWKSSRNICHTFQSQADIWQLVPGLGYWVRVGKAGPYELPGAITGHEHDCPSGQHWDMALSKCVVDTPAPIIDLSVAINWIKANPLLAAGIGLGGLLILSGGLKVKI